MKVPSFIRYKKGVNLCSYSKTGTAKRLTSYKHNQFTLCANLCMLIPTGFEIGGFVLGEQEAKASLYQIHCSFIACFVSYCVLFDE